MRTRTSHRNPVPFGLWTTGSFQYDGAGNIKKMGNSTYTYDAVSRLASATVYASRYSTGSAQTESYSFDAFGNLQSKITNGAQVNTPTTASSNHLTGASYDGSGNQLSWNGASYEYDALSMMTRMVSGGEDWRYIYTADDERFWSYRVGGGGSLWSLRGLDGKVLRLYNAHVNWSNLSDYVYREGTLASAVTNGIVSHLHPDHLGTPRLISTATGGADQVTFHTYFPFGEETPATFSSAYADRLRFTGHERDIANVTGQADDLDYMHARYHSPLTGRLLSVDKILGRPNQPQTWNRYVYARNNPIKFVDQTGLLAQLSGCVKEADSDTCKFQQDLVRDSVGKEAAKYLKFGENGLVSLSGISARAFGRQFGAVAGGLGRLIANPAATFRVVTDNPAAANRNNSGGAQFVPDRGVTGGTIFLDPSKFPKSMGGVTSNSTEVFVHEAGHALGMLYPGIRDSFDAAAARSPWTLGEGYATAFQNRYRLEVVGVDKNDIRTYYSLEGDLLLPPTSTPLFPE